MLGRTAAALVLITGIFGSTHATLADSSPKISFEQFPAKDTFSGSTTYPDFGGRDRHSRRYRTRIRNGLKEGPNFAGEYRAIQIGCGTECSFVFIASNRTGQVFDFPRGGEDNLRMILAFNISSRLILAQWGSYGSDCVVEYFEWTDGAAKLLKSETVGDFDACVREINAP